MNKARRPVIGLCVALLLSAGAMAAAGRIAAPGTVAAIYQDGVCIRRIDLNTVSQRETFTVSCPAGTNTVCVEPGRICVLEANCPDGICVRQGWLKDSPEPNVCLPHGLVVQLEGPGTEDGPDAVAH